MVRWAGGRHDMIVIGTSFKQFQGKDPTPRFGGWIPLELGPKGRSAPSPRAGLEPLCPGMFRGAPGRSGSKDTVATSREKSRSVASCRNASRRLGLGLAGGLGTSPDGMRCIPADQGGLQLLERAQRRLNRSPGIPKAASTSHDGPVYGTPAVANGTTVPLPRRPGASKGRLALEPFGTSSEKFQSRQGEG